MRCRVGLYYSQEAERGRLVKEHLLQNASVFPGCDVHYHLFIPTY